MNWIMSIAAGLAVGYFAWQMFAGKKGGGLKTTGRLHKSVKDKKISGVCGGIAEYLNTDPTIIRLVFALLALGWGSGIMAYFLCSLILPEGDADEETDSDADENADSEANENAEGYTAEKTDRSAGA